MTDLIAYILDHQAAVTLALGWIASEALSLSRRIPANGVIQLIAQGLAWAVQRAPDALAVLARITPQRQMASTASDKLPDKLGAPAPPPPNGSAQSPPIPAAVTPGGTVSSMTVYIPVAAPAPQKGPVTMASLSIIGTYPDPTAVQIVGPDGAAAPVAAPGPIIVISAPGADHGTAQAVLDIATPLLPLLTPGAKVTADTLAPVLEALGHEIHQPAVEALADLLPAIAPLVGKKTSPWALITILPALYAALLKAGVVKA